MTLDEVVQWLTRHQATVEFIRLAKSSGVKVTVRSLQRAVFWSDVCENQAAMSVPTYSLVKAIEQLDRAIGS